MKYFSDVDNISPPTMSAKHSEGDTVPEDESDWGSQLVELLTTLVAAVFTVGWSLFWAAVVETHLAMGDMLSAVFTATMLVVPVVAAFVWYVVESHGFDVPTPDVDASVIGS